MGEIILKYPIRTFNHWNTYTNDYIYFKLNISLKKSKYLIYKLISNVIRKEFKQNYIISKAFTKTRGLVTGSKKKPWKQKGTGKARAGSKYSPLWKGGGITFGPYPKIKTIKINRKLWLLAFQYLLFNKKSNIIIIKFNYIEKFNLKKYFILFIEKQLNLCGILKYSNILCITPYKFKLNNLKINKILFKSINTLKCKNLLHNDYIILFL